MSSRRATVSLPKRVLTIFLSTTLIVFATPLTITARVVSDVSSDVMLLAQQGQTWLKTSWELATATAPAPRQEPTGTKPIAPPAKSERALRVASIETNLPEEITLQSRQRILLSGIPLDSTGATVQGLTVQWESANKRVVFTKRNGEAVAGEPGTTTVFAKAGNKQRTMKVTVVRSSKEFGGKKTKDSTRPEPGVGLRTNETSNTAGRSARQKRAHANSSPKRPGFFFIRDPSEDPLPDNETSSLYQPSNLVGTTPGKKKPGASAMGSAITSTEAGNKNFSFEIPAVGLPGRGMDVVLDLFYNSLLYNRSTNPFTQGTWLTYDVDSGYPAQGFRLGYGQIEDQGSQGFTLIEQNGTRRALVNTATNTYETNDGTFIKYFIGGGSRTLTYSEGTQVTYGAAGTGDRSYPTKLTDRNGNYILISYVNNVGPRISTIQDTMGRYVRFYYDSNNDLVTITMPGLTGQPDNQVIRFYYENLSLTTSGLFSTSINVSIPTTARVIKYIYLPDSAEGSGSSDGDCGYRFDYSPYGMIYQIVKFRGMTASTTSTTSTGTVTEGTNTIAATTTYNYPLTAQSLTEAPTFTQRTDDWAGRTTASAPQTFFSVSEQSTETISTVTTPDGTVTESRAIKNPGQWNDGLISEVRVQNATPVVFSKTMIDWEQSPSGGPPRVISTRVTNEAGKTRGTVLTYGTYNNVTAVSERDFTTNGTLGTELRRTETTYVTASNWINRRLLRLPSMMKIFPGGSSTPAYRIDYQYDNYGSNHANLTSRDDIIMHDDTYDPFYPPEETWDWVCTEWGINETGFWGCMNWEWQLVSFYDPYQPATDYRGNITSVIKYPDAASTSNTISHSTTYDIAGNILTEQLDCCQQRSYTFTNAFEYAYSSSSTDGPAGGPQLTRSRTFDFNTGLVASETDENSQVTSYAYNPDTLRTSQVNFADGGRTSYDYGDNLVADSAGKYHSRVTTTFKLDATRFVDMKEYFNGRNAPTATFDSYTTTNGWHVKNIQYDSMGRRFRTSNPYFSTSDYGSAAINPSGIWTTRTFDNLGRTTQVTMPRGDDASPTATNSIQMLYQGDVITLTDQAGKQRRQVVDALGRVIRLHEPNSSGALGTVSAPNQESQYLFDVLNNTVRITQGVQSRYFKYDSLSRRIREKQPEQDANASYNLSDSLTGNSSWSRKTDYNSHGRITRSSDARGIHSDFYYDGLNRVTLIDYSDATPDGRFYYDSQTLPSGAPSYTRGAANGRLVAATYGTSSSTTGSYYGYDAMGRVNVQKQVTGSNTYSLSYSYNLAGLLASQTYPSNRVVSYSYDNAARLSQVSDGTTTFANGFAYHPSGAMTSETWGNGAVHSVAYNTAMQVGQVKLKQSSSGSELQRYDYLYGQVTQSNGSVDKTKNTGQVARIDATINGAATKEWEQRFSYDEVGRLSIASEYQQGTGSTPTWKQEFTYDRYGNRFQSGAGNTGVGFTPVVSSDVTAATNRFISTGAAPVTYDAAGNITQDKKFRIDPQGDGMNYTYDANGRQVTAAGTDENGSQAFTYDAKGLRVQTSGHNITRQMVYDINGQLVADYKGGALERENIYREGQLLAVYEAASTWYKTLDQFIKDFYQGVLGRQPNATELTNWTNTLGRAQARGLRPLIGAAQDLGNSLFLSTEYTNMNTTPTQFVTDLYEGFLQRAPDGPGLSHWASQVPLVGRDNVRLAFAVSPEFSNNIAAICPGTSPTTSTSANLKYVLLDAQGSARAVMNNSGVGSSTIISRHDYLPFGEEIWAGVGLRTAAQKYATTDKVRQKFGLTERDEATGLDHTLFRKYESYSGRWTSPDPYLGSIDFGNPQSFNRYAYVNSDPLNFVDPTGLQCWAVYAVTTFKLNGEKVDETWEFLFVYCDITTTSPWYSPVGPPRMSIRRFGLTEQEGQAAKPATPEQVAAHNRQQAQRAYDECMTGKYEELKKQFRPELERIMNRGLRNALIRGTVGALAGVVGMMAGAMTTYPDWLDKVEDFEREKLGPAREAAKAECRKQAGIN